MCIALAIIFSIADMRDDGSQGYVIVALIVGAIESALAGYIGMYIATKANVRNFLLNLPYSRYSTTYMSLTRSFKFYANLRNTRTTDSNDSRLPNWTRKGTQRGF